ncbi:MAG: DPP IV N-terminal domain-containing protein [Bacteroidales bacterium]|jgi:dipeptidyl-peptidase-4|nr:DPP IV N-terminal domain-containing protein [Bacteroidales bacterium]
MMRRMVLALMALVMWSAYAQNGGNSIELNNVVDGIFKQETLPSMTFMADGEHFAKLEDGKRIVQYSIETGEEVGVMLSPDRLTWEGDIEGFSFSEDNNYILFYTDKEQVYRHSFDARYYLYSFRMKQLVAIAEGEKLRAAVLSPDAKKLAYVKDNDIYVYHTAFKSNRQVTEDGEINKIINGVPDWVYEEEFSCNRLMEWSPDSRFLAWVRFDESAVPEFSFPWYEDAGLENGYLDRYVYKYPKAGAKNSSVSAHVFDYENKVSRKIKVDTETEEVYLPRIFWSKSAEKLGVARLNRHQNDLQILFANPKSGICTIAVSEKNERYIDQPSYTALTFLDDGLHFVYQSERDGYNHLYLYTMAGRMVKQLTQGDFDVTAFYGYDADTKTYYYQAAKKSPLEREVYSLNAKKGETCITPNTGTSTILFSPKFLYSIRSFNSATQPYYAKVYDKKSVELYTVVDNDELETM